MSKKSDCLYCGGHKAYHKRDATHCKSCWTCEDCQMHGCDVNYDGLHHHNAKSSKGRRSSSKQKSFKPNFDLPPSAAAAIKAASITGRRSADISPVARAEATAERWQVWPDDEDSGDQGSGSNPYLHNQSTEQREQLREQLREHLEKRQRKRGPGDPLSPEETKLTELLEELTKGEGLLPRKPEKSSDRKVRTFCHQTAPVPSASHVTDDGHMVCAYRAPIMKGYEAIPHSMNGTITINGNAYHHFAASTDSMDLKISRGPTPPNTPAPVTGLIHLPNENDAIYLLIVWNAEESPDHSVTMKYDVVEAAPKKPKQTNYNWTLRLPGEPDIHLRTVERCMLEAFHSVVEALGPERVSKATSLRIN